MNTVSRVTLTETMGWNFVYMLFTRGGTQDPVFVFDQREDMELWKTITHPELCPFSLQQHVNTLPLN